MPVIKTAEVWQCDLCGNSKEAGDKQLSGWRQVEVNNEGLFKTVVICEACRRTVMRQLGLTPIGAAP